uniref:Lipocln_cytosolic_FA-bd_dom domain-containing protein n=1 Tax=Parastrongyloides trichosuri TaxID=131310 RepID=A0A0N4Z4V4_PARTI
MFKANSEESFYEDKFVMLTYDYLIIKKYFFPSLKDKKIFTADIKIVYFEEQSKTKIGDFRIWGKTSNGVYWAYDLKRSLPGNKEGKVNVVLDTEDGLKKGFSVENSVAFISAIRNICGFNLIIADHLNV